MTSPSSQQQNALHLQMCQACQEHIQSLLTIQPLGEVQIQLADLDHQIAASDFWCYAKKAGETMKQRKTLSEYYEMMTHAQDYVALCNDTLHSGEEISPTDFAWLFKLNAQLHEYLFKLMMSEPTDNTPAIISISAGAGGLEAANWVSMLSRMYCRYADQNGFSIEILDDKPSEEHSSICTDNITLRIEGQYAYGYLKGESGVHRLIRNSPFNAGNARQTSFAAVSVSPDVEDTIEVKIEEKDLEITTQTAGGPGGQNQNRVKSAIRLKHLPTGINIFVRTERDQLANKKTAMKMLKSKLYELEIQKRQQETDQHIASLSDVSFGHQIRTYTMSPQALVKDHRTTWEHNDVEGFLDGHIENSIQAFLTHSKKKD